MERSQLQLGSKVKLKLEQPAIICGGRKRVTCYYRGVVSYITEKYIYISFKANKEKYDRVGFEIITDQCQHPNFLDLKIQ